MRSTVLESNPILKKISDRIYAWLTRRYTIPLRSSGHDDDAKGCISVDMLAVSTTAVSAVDAKTTRHY